MGSVIQRAVQVYIQRINFDNKKKEEIEKKEKSYHPQPSSFSFLFEVLIIQQQNYQ